MVIHMVMIVSEEHYIYHFGPDLVPAAFVNRGDVVKLRTKDAFSNQIKKEGDLLTEIDFSKVNPATGPVYVKGAKKGDVLRIKILDIEINDWGVVSITPNGGVLGKMVEKPKTRICKLKDGYIIFNNKLRIKSNPMIGVIGVASEERVSCGVPGRHGGNMDTNLIGKGATLYLPVFQEGGLFALGDLHAVMADGEVCVTGCEIRGEVTVEVDTLPSLAPQWPVVETQDAFYIIVSHENISSAIEEAVELGVRALQHSNDISWEDAYMLGSLIMDVEISQLVDPRKTVRVRIPKEYASITNILEAIKMQ